MRIDTTQRIVLLWIYARDRPSRESDGNMKTAIEYTQAIVDDLRRVEFGGAYAFHLIRTTIQQAMEDERQACAMLICEKCAEGESAGYDKQLHAYYHGPWLCAASSIYKRGHVAK